MRQGDGTGAGRRARARGTLDPSAGDPAGPDGTADGPVKDRVKMLLAAVVAAGTGFVLVLVFATVFNLYKGTRSGYLGPEEHPAVARVGACERLGPVSRDGIGYWWQCHAAVRVADGRVVNTVVDRSILTPADAGRAVEFREACKGQEGKHVTGCSYGRPVGRGWKGAVAALNFLERILVAVCAFGVVLFLVRGVLGRRGYARLYDRFSRRRRVAPGLGGRLIR
jgi:uncharacterized protein DUF6346